MNTQPNMSRSTITPSTLSMHPFAILLLASIVSLSACSLAPHSNHNPSESTRLIGKLVLRETVHVPPEAATLRFQRGRITAFNAVQEYEPFCIFELDTVSAEAQQVLPEAFVVTRISRTLETFSGMPVPMFARIGLFDRDDGPSHIYAKTTLHLQPTAQRVRSLTCMKNVAGQPTAWASHLTLQEMRSAWGAYFLWAQGH
jgi:hypothetical protein